MKRERETEWEVGHMDCTNGCRRANHRSSEELFHLVMFGGHHMGPPSPRMLAEGLSLSCPFLFFLSLFPPCFSNACKRENYCFQHKKNNINNYIDDEWMTVCFQRPWEMWQGFVFPFLFFPEWLLWLWK